MVVNITPFALSKLREILQSQSTKKILFFVKGGGCNGFNYNMKPTIAAKPIDEVVEIDNEHQMIVCGKSLIHVMGVTIDYRNTIMGSGFEFDNPNASGRCGCGKSFN